MNPIEGQIHIDIYPREIEDNVVEITSNRPLQAPKVLMGKTPQQVLSIIPLMYNICGTAHSRAALKSLQQCMQVESDPGKEIARDMMLLAEIAREHLMRIFLDWPKLFAIDAPNPGFALLNRLRTDFGRTLFLDGQAFALDSTVKIHGIKIKKLIEELEEFMHQHVFSQSPSDWLNHKDVASVLLWSEKTQTISSRAINRIYSHGWASQGITACQQLPELDSGQLLDKFNSGDADQFILQPKWGGQCFETTALSRQLEYPLVQSFQKEFQSSLITRWVARLVELARIPQQLSMMLTQLIDRDFDRRVEIDMSNGITQVESARGRLIHRVAMEQGVISHYQILAPTEWNFHPHGIAFQSLASIETDDSSELSQLAHLLISAIDPCVGYELRVH